MKKLISFRTFKKYCYWILGKSECGMTDKKCCEKNCPIWRRLKEVKDD